MASEPLNPRFRLPSSFPSHWGQEGESGVSSKRASNEHSGLLNLFCLSNHPPRSDVFSLTLLRVLRRINSLSGSDPSSLLLSIHRCCCSFSDLQMSSASRAIAAAEELAQTATFPPSLPSLAGWFAQRAGTPPSCCLLSFFSRSLPSLWFCLPSYFLALTGPSS
jgi:hypothetical protein